MIAIENVRLFDEVQARTRELSEALEQQTATSEVLRVIQSSPGELEPVFKAMLENAVRICDASFRYVVSDSRTEPGVPLRCSACRRHSLIFGDADRNERVREPRWLASLRRGSPFILSMSPPIRLTLRASPS